MNHYSPLLILLQLLLSFSVSADSIQAVSLREAALALGITPVEIRTAEREDGIWHRVLAGPFRDAASYEAASTRLRASQLPVTPVQE